MPSSKGPFPILEVSIMVMKSPVFMYYPEKKKGKYINKRLVHHNPSLHGDRADVQVTGVFITCSE